jgi:hypothetical protein
MTGRGIFVVAAALVFGSVGLFLVAVFGPLFFPLSLTNSSEIDSGLIVLMLACCITFGAAAGAIAWKLTRRWAQSSRLQTIGLSNLRYRADEETSGRR